MHPGLVLGATLLGGAAVVGGAYTLTTHTLTSSASSAPSAGAGAGQEFLVAVCVTQPALVHVPDARCVAATRHAAKAGTNPAAAPVAWRYLPSSTVAPTDIPIMGVEVPAGSFTDDPTLSRYVEDDLDIYGRPAVRDHPSGITRIITSRGTL